MYVYMCAYECVQDIVSTCPSKNDSYYKYNIYSAHCNLLLFKIFTVICMIDMYVCIFLRVCVISVALIAFTLFLLLLLLPLLLWLHFLHLYNFFVTFLLPRSTVYTILRILRYRISKSNLISALCGSPGVSGWVRCCFAWRQFVCAVCKSPDSMAPDRASDLAGQTNALNTYVCMYVYTSSVYICIYYI